MKIENHSLIGVDRDSLKRMLTLGVGEFFDDNGRLLSFDVLAERGLDKLARRIELVEKRDAQGRVTERISTVELWDRSIVGKRIGIPRILGRILWQ